MGNNHPPYMTLARTKHFEFFSLLCFNHPAILYSNYSIPTYFILANIDTFHLKTRNHKRKRGWEGVEKDNQKETQTFLASCDIPLYKKRVWWSFPIHQSWNWCPKEEFLIFGLREIHHLQSFARCISTWVPQKRNILSWPLGSKDMGEEYRYPLHEVVNYLFRILWLLLKILTTFMI